MKPLKITDRTTRALMIVTGLFLFTYVLLRAYLLSFTWDEAYTYLYFVRDHAWLPYEFTTMAANDHLLNTWLMKCCAILFGNSEFSLRLPNVLFFLVYLYFSFRIAFCFSNPVHRLCAFLLLCLNPYQLDFFGAARGYGMSFALLSGALYFTLTYFTRQRNVLRALAALLLSMLAVLANLSLLIFLLTLASIFALSIIRHHFSERRMLKTIVQLFIVLAPVLVFVLRSLPYIFRLRDCGALFYGGEKDIFTDTFLTLAHCTLYGFYGSRFMAPVLACGFVALIATGGILASRFLLKRELKGEKAFVASLAVLLLACALGSMLQFYVL
ncbi:MAG TPA: glycosyltransferase family 39 protein, partial [Bacteroidia bacterium]